MLNAINSFRSNIAQTEQLIALFDYLHSQLKAPMDFDDLLRSKIVYAVSAFDKLMHDLIRIGMVEIFNGARAATPKYSMEPIQMHVVQQLSSVTPPPSFVFESAIRAKLKILSFQDPDKIADGLSYIWAESQKWQKIAAAIGAEEKALRTTLKLVASRRNAIVHEADLDPITGVKLPVSRDEAVDIVQLLKNLGEGIYNLVK
ncbi:HEPN domain-containing protein [Stutzerimonas stutzeri]|uniref:HEPN domain-containing protein n=1 Tax=Stutzerimonas stutzeri TaxID=316 RepID=UPI000396F0B4|nr:HEPN domain-containing protein [Stutzerimonas stutzeri]EQM79113.1 hypothetical protein L686_02255 [Stutzerimonas stutzeri MF28]